MGFRVQELTPRTFPDRVAVARAECYYFGTHKSKAGHLINKPFRGISKALKGTYRVFSWYIRIPGLRAHARGPRFQPQNQGQALPAIRHREDLDFAVRFQKLRACADPVLLCTQNNVIHDI